LTVPPQTAWQPSSESDASPADLEESWSQLLGDELSAIERATFRFVQAKDLGLPFLREKVRELGEEIRESLKTRESELLAAFRAAVSEKEGGGRLAYLEGRLLQRRGEHEEAKARFEKAARLEATSLEPVLRFAEVSRSLGDSGEAAKRLIQALRGPARGSRACWGLWFEIVLEDLDWTLADVLNELPVRHDDRSRSSPPLDEYALQCRAALEVLRACGVVHIDSVDPDRWPPVVTVAYWDFEDGSPGRVPLSIGQGPRDVSGNPLPATRDRSGHRNHLYSRFSWTGPRFGVEVPASVVPQTGRANRLCLDDRGEPPRGTPTQDLYTYSRLLRPLRVDSQLFALRQWTIEASFRLAELGRVHGIVTKTTPGHILSAKPLVELMVLEDGGIQLEIMNQQGSFRRVKSATPAEVDVWYHVAGVSDGSSLKLYVDRGDGSGYQLEGTGEAGGAVAVGSGSWCVGRGEEGRQITHDARALIDEVRISAVALPPERFLFAER
jgi:hypothetical protein